jgi:hypothetical protein
MRNLTLLASAAAVTAVVLSGCGNQQAADQGGNGGSTGDTPANSLQLLAENMAKQSTEKSSTHMVFRADAAGVTVEGEGDVRLGAQPAMDVTLTLPGQGSMDMRLVDNVAYVKLPQEVEPGKPWVKIDANGTDPISQALGDSLEQMKTNGDPSKMIQQLKDAGQITAQKSEELNGEQTTHYSITVDVAKAANASGMEEMLAEARKAGVSQIPLELWVNQENLPVRMSMEMPVKDPSSQASTTVKVSVDYSDWGKPVDVAAPPAAEVAEIPR